MPRTRRRPGGPARSARLLSDRTSELSANDLPGPPRLKCAAGRRAGRAELDPEADPESRMRAGMRQIAVRVDHGVSGERVVGGIMAEIEKQSM